MFRILVALLLLGISVTGQKINPRDPDPIHHGSPAPANPPHVSNWELVMRGLDIAFEPFMFVNRLVPSGPNPLHNKKHPKSSPAPAPAASKPSHMSNW
ncbi:unnamed protein product, partial [Linum tenue]